MPFLEAAKTAAEKTVVRGCETGFSGGRRARQNSRVFWGEASRLGEARSRKEEAAAST